MTAPMPGGATRNGTLRRMQASATSGVDRPANSASIPACPGSIPVTRQRLPAGTRGHLERSRGPCGSPAPDNIVSGTPEPPYLHLPVIASVRYGGFRGHGDLV